MSANATNKVRSPERTLKPPGMNPTTVPDIGSSFSQAARKGCQVANCLNKRERTTSRFVALNFGMQNFSDRPMNAPFVSRSDASNSAKGTYVSKSSTFTEYPNHPPATIVPVTCACRVKASASIRHVSKEPLPTRVGISSVNCRVSSSSVAILTVIGFPFSLSSFGMSTPASMRSLSDRDDSRPTSTSHRHENGQREPDQ